MNEPLTFYPKHPSDQKTAQIENTAMPILPQNAPFAVKSLFDAFYTDLYGALKCYEDKRFEITGIVVKVGPDIHHKPSIELSDCFGGTTYALAIFPTDEHYSRVSVGDTVTIRANYLVFSNWFGIVMKHSELIHVKKNKVTLNYPMFDGIKLWKGASVTVENGLITSVQECDSADCKEGFLMPGLIDAHTHMGTDAHVNAMLHSGITAVCDVSASKDFIASSKQLDIISSAGMAMGIVENPDGYVEQAAANGAKYIKVLLANAHSLGESALCRIVQAAHQKGLKVAVHVTETATVRQAVDADADILLHVPMKEVFPAELAKLIAQKGIAVAPTLVMMETFACSGQNGYQITDYQNAENAVKLLHECNVMLLAATDANPGTFAPAVSYGESLHKEMTLLVKAGLTPLEVLTAATSRNAAVFSYQAGRIAPGQPATMLLLEGRPDRLITDCHKIQKIWVKGEAVQ